MIASTKHHNRAEQRRETRSRLLDAAATVFARQGFHAASVDDVAEAAGFTKGAVYANFGSKEELFLALLDRRIEADVRWFDDLLRIDGDAHLFAVLTRRVEPDDGDGDGWLLLFVEFWLYAARNPSAASALADRYRTLRARLADYLGAQFAREAEAPPMDVNHLAAALLGLSNGLALQRVLDPASVPPSVYAAAAFRLVAGEAPSPLDEDGSLDGSPSAGS